MANTHEIPNYAERINKMWSVDELPESLHIALTDSQNHDPLARIELNEFEVTSKYDYRHPLGRLGLSMTLIDRSGMPEWTGTPNHARLTINLGEIALVGRANHFDLPLLESETVSERHLALSLLKSPDGLQFLLSDTESSNGSRFISHDGTELNGLEERLRNVSNGDDLIRREEAQEGLNHEWLYDSRVPRPVEYNLLPSSSFVSR